MPLLLSVPPSIWRVPVPLMLSVPPLLTFSDPAPLRVATPFQSITPAADVPIEAPVVTLSVPAATIR